MTAVGGGKAVARPPHNVHNRNSLLELKPRSSILDEMRGKAIAATHNVVVVDE